MKKKLIFRLLPLALIVLSLQASCSDKKAQTERPRETFAVYQQEDFYPVREFKTDFSGKTPKNFVLLIGDGMGIAHIHAGMVANGGSLFLQNFPSVGFTFTHSYNSFVTGSAEAATAIASGKKSYSGAIGVDEDTIPVKTVLHKAIERGLATGLVSTSSITHATPAGFIAHQPNREMHEEIAADFLKYDIDLFIGGGTKFFSEREDEQDLISKLKEKGYQVSYDIDEIAKIKSGKLAGLTAGEHNGRIEERGDMLPIATEAALNILSNNEKGFFIMIEGSQIDWGGHNNDLTYLIEEMLDFDKAIGKALEFAEANGETLVIVASDHETGGLTLHGGDYSKGRVRAKFASSSHTGLVVPIFAYGPGAELFTGFIDNTDIHNIIDDLMLRLN